MKSAAKTMPMKVLSVKVLDPELIGRFARKGLQVDCVEAIRTSPLEGPPASPGPYDAIAFTSDAAVHIATADSALAAKIRSKPVFALSGSTAQALAGRGIGCTATAANAEALALAILADSRIGSVLHYCGELSLGSLRSALSAQGRQYAASVLYRTELLYPKVNGPYDVVLFFSPSGIESYLRHNRLDPNVRYGCIGATTTARLHAELQGLKLFCPARPSVDEMLEEIINFGAVKN